MWGSDRNGGHDGDGHIMNPDGIRRMSDTEQILISSGGLSDSSMEPDPDEGDPIMVGVVGSAHPGTLPVIPMMLKWNS